jgi:hypothetical protein
MKYISFVNTSYYIFTRGYATLENIASGVHSVKLYFNLICKTNKYPLLNHLDCNTPSFEKYFMLNLSITFHMFSIYISQASYHCINIKKKNREKTQKSNNSNNNNNNNNKLSVWLTAGLMSV